MNADLNVAPEFDPNVFVLDVPDSSSIVSNSNNSLFPVFVQSFLEVLKQLNES